MSAISDDMSIDDDLKKLLCEKEMPFPMTFQERVLLFQVLDKAAIMYSESVTDFIDMFEIRPSAFRVLETLHGKFVQSFHGGGIPFEECQASLTIQS